MKPSAALEMLRETELELRRLAELARAMTPEVESSLRAARETVECEGDRPLTIALVGESRAGRHAVADALLGAKVLSSSAFGRDARVTFVRVAARIDYTAHSRDGRRVVQFARRVPDRGEFFERALEEAEQQRAQELAQIEEKRRSLELARARGREAAAIVETVRSDLARAKADLAGLDAEAKASPAPPPYVLAKPAWWAFWLWLLRLVLLPRWRGRLQLQAARASDTTRARDRMVECEGALTAAVGDHEAAERALEEARASAEDTGALDTAGARLESLRAERDAHAREREAEFLRDLRAMGDAIAELTIEYPATDLSPDVTLLDLPSPATEEGRRVATSAVHRDADGFLSIEIAGRAPSAAASAFLEQVTRAVPCLLVIKSTPDGLITTGVAASVARIQQARSLVVVARAAMRLGVCLDPLTRARDEAEMSRRKRLAALEGQRIPDPAEFRAGQMARAHSAIEKSADDALQSALVLVSTEIAGLRREWTDQILSCADRSAIETCVRSINDSVSQRVGDVLERTTERVAQELQGATEAIETWALEEMHTRYQLVRRLGAEALAPLASELTRDDLDVGPRSLHGALDTFERGRVGYGLGGVAAGAAIGTLVLPGIGTAIGAFLGVFAGFLKGVDSLKQECVARVGACLTDAESHAFAQLQNKRPDLSRVLRVTIDDGLGQALERLEQAISRLLEVERRAIAGEVAKLEELGAARAVLVRSEERVAKIGELLRRGIG